MRERKFGLYLLLSAAAIMILLTFIMRADAAPPKSPRAKFYDFSEQVIDGQIKKPTALYTDSRQKVKFNRLLKLKKSFLPNVLESAKDPVFQ
tara:strand:- start:4 stop:279 length:276 start_codon:yes stop_codon:yes gene_type:complete